MVSGHTPDLENATARSTMKLTAYRVTMVVTAEVTVDTL